jgi:hypothetical protein
MLETLINNTWLIAIVWAALYIFDHASTSPSSRGGFSFWQVY